MGHMTYLHTFVLPTQTWKKCINFADVTCIVFEPIITFGNNLVIVFVVY
jgi:hypothetical protein